MAFNRHLAEEITKHRSDCNKALYFAGREAELGAAHNAFAEARNYSQTVFRVFTGAPGCGKSSLLTHIQEMNAAEPGLLFVDPDEENLHSRAALMDFVADEAIDHLASSTADRKQWAADVAAKYATPLAQSLGEAFRIKTAGEMLSEWQRKRGLDGLVVVIVYDETQNADEKVLSTLSQLHKQGIRGIPSVALLAGLSHGKQVLSKAGLGGPISLDSPRAETRCTPDGFRLPSMWIVTPLAGFPREVLTRADLVRGWMRARACLHGAARQNPRNGARRRIFAASARGVLGEAVAAVTRPPGDGSGRPRRASCRPATSAAGDGCRTRSSRR